VLVAQALVHKPPVIVLDEPTAGVDVELRQSLWAFVRKLNRDGHTIILTTHYLEEAEQLCERVIVLDRGRVVADATREAFLRMAGDFLTVDIRSEAAGRIRRLFESDGAVPVATGAEGLRFVVPGSSRAALLRKLAEAAPEIESFEILKPKLEEVFVKLTAKEDARVRLG
jgi:ABC-2 type transport system ATP-binding protein